MARAHAFAPLPEGIQAGLLGASGIACWFFLLDLADGRPFATPSVLGQAILFGINQPVISEPVWSAVLAYTALHLTAFLGIGVAAAAAVSLAERSGLALFGLLMVGTALEFLFVGVATVFFVDTAGLFPVWAVLSGNVWAGLVMGWFLLRRHPALRHRFRNEPLGG